MMLGVIEAGRGIAQGRGQKGIWGALEGGRRRRWQDKSAAVGRGACGWIASGICAVSPRGVPSLAPKILANSTPAAPSLDIPSGS